MILVFIIIYGCVIPIDAQQVTESFLGQIPPGIKPIRFAPEIITDNFFPHSKMIFFPKGNRIYWTTFLNLDSRDKALFYSDFDGKNLSRAKKETILAQYGILHFVFSNDGNKIFFGSLQPYDRMDGKPVRAVWTCEKTESAWSKPRPIESTVDTNWASLGSVSINQAGDIYFTGRMEGKTAKIHCAKSVNGSYPNVESLPDIINTGITIDPFIDYNDKFLLFAASHRTDNVGIIDLYISYKNRAGSWTQPINIGQGISTPFCDRFPLVTRDGKYLIFVTSNANHFPSKHTHFYWVDAKIIEKLNPDGLK
jgi:hypothetical protein